MPRETAVELVGATKPQVPRYFLFVTASQLRAENGHRLGQVRCVRASHARANASPAVPRTKRTDFCSDFVTNQTAKREIVKPVEEWLPLGDAGKNE